jgi:hypothetical protein
MPGIAYGSGAKNAGGLFHPAGDLQMVEILRQAWQICLVALIFSAVAALSFVLTGGFTADACSERIFWVGIGMFLLAGTIAFAQSVTGKSIIRKPEEAKKLLDHHLENRELTEKRYNAAIQVWLVGGVCIAISALVELLL